MSEAEKLKIAIAALNAIAIMPMSQFSYHKAFTVAVMRAEQALKDIDEEIVRETSDGGEE